MTRRAVVMGASIAGLLMARVLADVLDEVVLVDRDELPAGPVDRPGVPHAAHAHVLLRRGYLELGRLYPGIDRELARQGAVPVDLTRDAIYITPGGESPRFASGLRSRAASRALFESVIRTLTLERPNVRVLARREVVGLVGDRGGVHGIRIERREAPASRDASVPPTSPGTSTPSSADGSGVQELSAWLVVDTSGRTSRAPAFLAEIGAHGLEESVVDASLRYATRIFRIPPGARDWSIMLVRDRPPGGTRGGGIFPLEGGRWVVTLGGAGNDQPLTGEAAFLDFARSLISPRLHDAIREAEPLTPVRGWARTANRWRHVERVDAWPAGFAVASDALCALNPVYGQGMSVAAMEAGTLARWLRTSAVDRARRAGRPPETGSLVRGLARTARLPWFMATAEDSLVPGVTGAADPGPLGRVARRYLDEIHANVADDPRTLRRFTEVSQLVRPPIALLDPLVAWRVGRGVAARRARQRPT